MAITRYSEIMAQMRSSCSFCDRVARLAPAPSHASESSRTCARLHPLCKTKLAQARGRPRLDRASPSIMITIPPDFRADNFTDSVLFYALISPESVMTTSLLGLPSPEPTASTFFTMSYERDEQIRTQAIHEIQCDTLKRKGFQIHNAKSQQLKLQRCSRKSADRCSRTRRVFGHEPCPRSPCRRPHDGHRATEFARW